MAKNKDAEDLAKEMFTTSRDELLNEQLPRMEGWFDVTGGSIKFKLDLDQLSKGEMYITYLLGSFVAEIADQRETKFVEYSEIDSRFGWSSGRKSAHYASDYSELLEDNDGAKAIAEHSLEEAINEIAEKVKADER